MAEQITLQEYAVAHLVRMDLMDDNSIDEHNVKQLYERTIGAQVFQLIEALSGQEHSSTSRALTVSIFSQIVESWGEQQ